MFVDPKSSKSVAGLALRLSLGLSLVVVGLHHYMNFDAFSPMVTDELGALSFLGTIWAFLLPGLEIVGGALIAARLYPTVAAWTAGLALASIPFGLLLGTIITGADITARMEQAHFTFIWILVYYFAIKSMKCCCGTNCDPKK